MSALTATINATAGPTHATQNPVPGNTGTVTHPPNRVTLPTFSRYPAAVVQTETASRTRDRVIWLVVRKGDKVKIKKQSDQARCPCQGRSGPVAAAHRRHATRKVAGTSQSAPRPPSAQDEPAAGASTTQRPEWKDQAAAKRALNETVTPRVDHKRPRLDHSERVAQRSNAQAANASLDVAITCDNTGILSKDLSDKLLAAIQIQIIDEARSPKPDTPGPTFNAKPVFAKGVLKLWCGNDHTLAWLRRIVRVLAHLTSTPLVVKSQSEIGRRARCSIMVPDEQRVFKSTTDIRRALCYQNPWVVVKRWDVLYVVKKGAAAAWFVVVDVPVDQIPALMRAGRRLSLGVGAVYIKFKGQNGKYSDTPLGWDSTTETITEDATRQPMTPVRESTPPPNNPQSPAAEPAVAESAVPAAATEGAASSLSVKVEDMTLSPPSCQGEEGVDEDELLTGLELGEHGEGTTSDGVL